VTGEPLDGLRVLVPRAVAQAPELAERVRALGGEPVAAPVITIEPGDDAGLRAALQDLAAGAFGVVALTSPNGVDAVADALVREGLDARALAGADLIACVGPGTAARLWSRLRVASDLLPDAATTRSLAEAIPPGAGRVLLPRADLASPVLREVLAAKGYEPVEVVAYRTGRPPALPDEVVDALVGGHIDLLAFASSSTVRNFAELMGDRPWRGDVVSIGPVTSGTCRELGIEVAVEARPHDLDGLVDALAEAGRRRARAAE
jgi:uroporphyrinogen III methyltransferase / synthase